MVIQQRMKWGGKKEGMLMDERGEEKGIEFPVPFPLLLPERSPMRRSAPPQRIPVHRKCKPSLSGDLFTKKKGKKRPWRNVLLLHTHTR